MVGNEVGALFRVKGKPMKVTVHLFFVMLAVSFILLASPGYAFAYVDPFAGQVFFRILYPVIVGLGGIFIFARKILATLIRDAFRKVVAFTAKVIGTTP
ncbi:MAG: hypothetical protein ACLQJ7_10170 [Syntrophobacteraceae bacterium]